MYFYNILYTYILVLMEDVRMYCVNGGIIDLNLEDEYYKVYIYIYY